MRESAFYRKEGREGGFLLMDEPMLAVKRGNCLRNPILLGVRTQANSSKRAICGI